MIYLDNAATTYPKPECVYEEMNRVNRELAFNAGRGSYLAARDASSIIDETRHELIKLVHGNGTEKAVLTTSATEALNIILQGIDWHEGDIAFVSPYEHNAVARVLDLICIQKKIKVELLPLKKNSLEIDLDATKYLLVKHKPKCVCCTHVSNVTGYILPVSEIFEMAHEVGSITVLDASQSMGLVDINVNDLDADFISFAGHKTLYGPFGVGGFIDVNEVNLTPVFVGGTGSDSLNLKMPQKSPEKYEAASKNIVAISGLLSALKVLDVKKIKKIEDDLLEYLINEIRNIPYVKAYIDESILEKHVGIVSINLEGYTSSELGTILSDDYDIAVRTGYHCAPYIHKFLQDGSFEGTVRIGINQFNTKDDIDSLVRAIKEVSME